MDDHQVHELIAAVVREFKGVADSRSALIDQLARAVRHADPWVGAQNLQQPFYSTALELIIGVQLPNERRSTHPNSAIRGGTDATVGLSFEANAVNYDMFLKLSEVKALI